MTEVRREYPVCHLCGYDLRGLSERSGTKCPECGRRVNWQLAWLIEPNPIRGWSIVSIGGFMVSPFPGVLAIVLGYGDLKWWLGGLSCFLLTWGLVTARMMRAKAPIAVVIALIPSLALSWFYCRLVFARLGPI